MPVDDHRGPSGGREDREAQVTYHLTVAGPSYGEVVGDLVRPLLAELSATDPTGRWFFIRDWRSERTAIYLLGRDVHRDTSAALAAMVRRRVPEATVEATGDLTGLDGVASGPRGRALVEDMLCDTSRGLTDLIAAHGDDRREELAIDLMAAHLPAVHIGAVGDGFAPPEVPLSYLSYRYHAAGFFLMCSDPARVRAEMDRRYEAAAPAITERVRTVLDEVRAGRCAPESPAGWWYPLARRHLPAAIDGFRRGLVVNGSTDLRAGWLGDTHDLSDSPLHQVIQESPGYQDFLRVDPTFQAIRLLTAVLYLMVHTTGLRLIHRYFLCHAVSRAVEDVFGLDSAELATRIASGRFADPTGRATGRTADLHPTGGRPRP